MSWPDLPLLIPMSPRCGYDEQKKKEVEVGCLLEFWTNENLFYGCDYKHLKKLWNLCIYWISRWKGVKTNFAQDHQRVL